VATPSTTFLKAPPARPPKELLSSPTFLLHRLTWAVKERKLEAFESTGLNPTHYAVLALLDEGARETQATIADALGYDRSYLVGVLDELEERGLLERRRDPEDRRRHLVTLLPAGRETLTKLRSIARRVDKEFLGPLNPEEREALLGLLLRLAAHHDERFAGDSETKSA
jgi:MarR family transcriptional regulator, lower aerobic nicotinate degradation pathway regulator